MDNFTYVRAGSWPKRSAIGDANGPATVTKIAPRGRHDPGRPDATGRVRAARLVDITAIGNSKLQHTGSTELVFGALAKMSDVSAIRRCLREYPALAESLQMPRRSSCATWRRLGGNLLQRTRCEYFRVRVSL